MKTSKVFTQVGDKKNSIYSVSVRIETLTYEEENMTYHTLSGELWEMNITLTERYLKALSTAKLIQHW